jgi:hypothetical protein
VSEVKVGVLDSSEPYIYGDETTYRMGAEFLKDCSLVEDWGCGRGGLRKFVPPERYRGVDIGIDSVPQQNPFAHEQVDLIQYRSTVPAIFMRHVLEHNFRWREILANAAASFTERFVLVIFTPVVYGPSESIITLHGRPEYDCYPVPVPNLALPWPVLMEMLASFQIEHDVVRTATHYCEEHVLCMKR